MSVGRRLWNVARSELNSLLDKAREIDDDEDGPARSWDTEDILSAFSEDELAAEIEKRHNEREAERRTSNARATSSAGSAGRRQRAPGPTARDQDLRKAYAALEIPYGSDLETVKSAYRSLMRKYHPDRHTASPEAQKTAVDLTQRLTQAYSVLKSRLESG